MNGRKVDDHVLSPAVSDYSKRTLYVTHDVTDYLVEGANCIALWLGRGWYVKGHPGVIHEGPLVRAQLDARAARRSRAERSPPTLPGKSAPARSRRWAKERRSAITAASTTMPGSKWMAGTAVQLDDSGWQPATVFDPPQGHHGGADGRAQPHSPDHAPGRDRREARRHVRRRHGPELRRLVRIEAAGGHRGGPADPAGICRSHTRAEPVHDLQPARRIRDIGRAGTGHPRTLQLPRLPLRPDHRPRAKAGALRTSRGT